MLKFFLTILIILPFQLMGQCCSGGVPMSNNIGLPTAEKGFLQVNLNYDWNNLTTLKQETFTLQDNSRQRATHSLLLEIGYSITDKLSVDLFVPTIRQERTIRSSAGENFVFTEGMGDVVILPKYAITSQITVGIGIKLPTGSSDKRINGIALNADLQPGSGATDGIFYFAFQNYTKKRPSLGYFGNIIYRQTGNNDSYLGNSTYSFGNELQLIAGLADRFAISSVLIDPSFKLRYRIAGRDLFDESEFPGSGGRFLFVNPGLSVTILKELSWQINASIPVHTFVNDTQLSPTIQINTGLQFKINLKPKNPFEP